MYSRECTILHYYELQARYLYMSTCARVILIYTVCTCMNSLGEYSIEGLQCQAHVYP